MRVWALFSVNSTDEGDEMAYLVGVFHTRALARASRNSLPHPFHSGGRWQVHPFDIDDEPMWADGFATEYF